MRTRYPFSQHLHLLCLLAIAQLSSSCGMVKKSSPAAESASSSSAATTVAAASSYNLSGGITVKSLGLSSLNLDATQTIIKATYATVAEDSGTIASDGSYQISIKPLPFALTVFTGATADTLAPQCSFIFKVGNQKVGSIQPSSDMNLGNLTCADGQVVVDTSTIKGTVDSSFQAQIANGSIDAETKAKLLDAKGLQVTMLSQYSDRSNSSGQGSKLALGDGAPTVVTSQGQPQGQPQQGQPQGQPQQGQPQGQQGMVQIDPKVCTAAGYSVPDFFYNDFQANSGGNKDGGSDNAPTLFLKQNADASFSMRAESRGDDGQAQNEIFDNISLSGVGQEFALVGESQLPSHDIKASAASGILRQIMFTLNTGNEPPPMPTWTDMSCDPVQLVNTIVTSLGRSAYTLDSIFTQFGNFQKPGVMGAQGSSKPLCSTLTSGSPSSSLQTVKDLCFAADGKTAKVQTLTAAKMICQVAHGGGPVNYWTAVLKDDAGNPVKSCVKDSNNSFGTDPHHDFVAGTQADCDKLRNSSPPPSPGSAWVNYNWTDVQRNFNIDCSELRANKISLKECQFNGDNKVEPTFKPPMPQDVAQPKNWWDNTISLLDAAVAIDSAASSQGNPGGQSPLQMVKDTIDRCVGQFDRTTTELNKRRDKISGISTAVNLIASTTDSAGQLKYIKAQAGDFVKQGDFTFTADKITNLQAVLKKASTALDGWAGSIKDIKNTYGVLKNAALKAEQKDAKTCVADEIGTQAAFKVIYDKFTLAYNGDTSSTTSRGLKNWQSAALNHFMCMEMDDNLRRIRDFGINAPTSGIVDSNKTVKDLSSSMFLVAPAQDSLELAADTCDYTDPQGRCIKSVACQIPAGSETYIPFDTLLTKATIDTGCDNIVDKVAMMGRVNQLDHTVNGIDVPAGALEAKVLLMTSLPKADCKLTLQIPKLNKDSCFIYANTAGKIWGDLTSDQRAAAKASDYVLQYDSKPIPIQNIANREVIQVLLTPKSSITSVKDKQDATIKGGSSSQDLNQLINSSK